MLTILHPELCLSLLSLFAQRGLQQIQFSSNEIQLMGQHCRMLKINTTTPSEIAKNNYNGKDWISLNLFAIINTTTPSTTTKNSCNEKKIGFSKSVCTYVLSWKSMKSQDYQATFLDTF